MPSDIDCEPLRTMSNMLEEIDALKRALRPFAAIADHFQRGGYGTLKEHSDVLHGFHLVHGESVELRLSDCVAAQRAIGKQK